MHDLSNPDDRSYEGWDTGTIRQLLSAAFDDEELIAFCFDHFPAVCDKFGVGMSKERKIHHLLDYAVRNDQVARLLELLRELRGHQYVRFRYRQAVEAREEERWDDVVQFCAEMQELQPGYRDVAQLLAAAKEALQLAGLYEQAVEASQGGRWGEVTRLCAQIEDVRPGYRDVTRLRAAAEAAQQREPPPAEPPAPRPDRGMPTWARVLLGLVALAAAAVTVAVVLIGRRPPVLTIESHVDQSPVDRFEVMAGSYRNLRPGWHLWGLVQAESGEYWVQERFKAESPEGEWSLLACFGRAGTADIGARFTFSLLAVKEGSDAELVLENARAGFITELPRGQVRFCDSIVRVVRASPSDCWLADFWADEARDGNPVHTEEIPTTYLFREWWGPPASGLPETGWTARFARRFRAPEDGEYCFHRVGVGEVTVSVDGDALDIPREAVDWTAVESVCRTLAAGEHALRVDFARPEGEKGVVELWYDGPGVVPPSGPLTDTWRATFFPTADPDGAPVWVTSLPGPFLDFRPAAGDEAPAVSFRAVFSRTLAVEEAGTYRFVLAVDDGARFAIDGGQVLDEWHGGPATYTVACHLDASEHTLRLDLYERHGNQYAGLTWEEVADPIPPVQRVLFASDRDGDYDVYAMDADGANPVNLTHSDWWDYDPAWSPDGRRVVFVSDRRGGNPELHVMEVASGETRSLEVTGYQPRWSPDGSRIAYIDGASGLQEIYVMDADGTNVVQLTDNEAADFSPDWSPDGSRIAFESDRDGGQEIYVMNADGSDPVNVSRSPDTFDGTPAWSPDGARIAFSAYGDGDRDVYVMDADGGNRRRVAGCQPVDRFPDWSADGRYLFFEGTDADTGGWDRSTGGWGQIYRVDPDEEGGGCVPLTESHGRHERPQASPAGYGYSFESFVDSDDVHDGALAVAGETVWTGGNGGVVRWSRDDPGQRQTFTSEDGLAENNVHAILAEGENVLWFGTGGWPFGGSGVSRYAFGPGRERWRTSAAWRTYKAGDGLGSDTVFDLYQDSEGDMWAGTTEGARVFDGRRWRGFDELEDAWVRCILEASDGAFWFGLSGGGLARHDPTVAGDGAWQWFDPMDLLGSQQEGYRYVLDVVEGAPGEVWAATHAGVVHFDGETWRAGGGALDAWTQAAVRDRDGALWFGTSNGLVRVGPDGGQRTYTTADGLTGIVYALFLDDRDTLWAAGNGLSRYDRENDRWWGYRAPEGLAYNYVSAILQDTGGSFWFGHSIFYQGFTWDGGVSRYTPGGDDGWQHFSTDDGLSERAVHVIAQGRDGAMWFGFDRAGGGVCRADVGRDNWHCYQADPAGLASSAVDSIVQTGDGALWFGTSGGGLSRFDGERWESFTQANSGLLSDEVHCLAEDSEGAVWVTTDRGVNRFFYETGEWVPFTTGNSDLIADDVLALALDGSDVWLGTREGLSRYDVARRGWHTVEGTPALPGWVGNCAQLLHVDRHGTVWAGTGEGLYRSTVAGGWLRLTTADGLASNQVLAVFEDADGGLWVGTPSGVSRVEISE